MPFTSSLLIHSVTGQLAVELKHMYDHGSRDLQIRYDDLTPKVSFLETEFNTKSEQSWYSRHITYLYALISMPLFLCPCFYAPVFMPLFLCPYFSDILLPLLEPHFLQHLSHSWGKKEDIAPVTVLTTPYNFSVLMHFISPMNILSASVVKTQKYT